MNDVAENILNAENDVESAIMHLNFALKSTSDPALKKELKGIIEALGEIQVWLSELEIK